MMKVLVIEDDLLIKDNVVDILQEESFQAIDTANGLMGIKLAREHQPDLILCDVRMPQIDGYEVLKNLKQNSLTSSIPFIFLTSNTSRQSWRKGMELGADDYLTKPFTPRELLKAIAVRSNSRRRLREYSTRRNGEIKELKRVLRFCSNTGLPSRLSFQVKLEELVKQNLLENVTKLAQNKPIKLKIPIICLHFNDLPALNSSIGNISPSLLLKVITERLVTSTFAEGIITYLEAGMFALILPSVNTQQDVISTIQRIRKYFRSPIETSFNSFQLFSDISIGVSCYPENGTNLYTLIEQAKKAIQLAPYKSNQECSFYPPNQNSKTSFWHSFAAKREISRAFDLNLFQVTYQPQVCLKTGKANRYEAILGWQHPKYGYLSLAESMALIRDRDCAISLSSWFLDRALRQLKYWHNRGFDGLKIAIKVIDRHFYQDSFNLELTKIIQKYQLHYSHIELEIKESVLLENKQQSREKLNGLSNLGIGLTLDEFASGYTDLNYWQEFFIDKIKLNWQQLQVIFSGDRYQAIVKSAIALAHHKGIEVIATGRETPENRQFFAQHQLDFIQNSQSLFHDWEVTQFLLNTYNK